MNSVREANELLVHPDIIKNLRVGQCVLLRHNPTRLDLLNLRERKLIIEREQEDIEDAVEIKKDEENKQLIFNRNQNEVFEV